MHALSAKLEEESALVAKLQRQIKELQQRSECGVGDDYQKGTRNGKMSRFWSGVGDDYLRGTRKGKMTGFWSGVCDDC